MDALNSSECPLCAKLFLRKFGNKTEWPVLSRRGGSPKIGKTEIFVISPRNGSYISHSIKITCVKSFSKKRCHPLWRDLGGWRTEWGHSISPAFKTYVFTHYIDLFIRLYQVSVAAHRIFIASWGIFCCSVRAQQLQHLGLVGTWG